MTDYMLTTTGGLGALDVQVNNAGDIREAIELAEKVTGAMVDHGRGGIGSKFDPAIVIDAESGEVLHRHDRNALTSLTIVHGRNAPEVARALHAAAVRNGGPP